MGCGQKKRYDSNLKKQHQQLKTEDHKNIYKQLYANEMDNLEETYKFLEK